MKRIWLPVAPALLLLLACGPPVGEEAWNIRLPAGDADAGRAAFNDLGCVSCHRVVGDADLRAPVSAHPGPVLGPKQIRGGSGELATNIMLPSRRIDATFAHEDDPLRSPMGDYTEAMTVRELADVVAYIRQHALERIRELEREAGARNPPI